MQAADGLQNAVDYLRVEFAWVVAQATVWSDRIYWSGYGPLAETALLAAAAAAAALCLYAYTDENDVQVWSSLGVAGRWMGGAALVVLALSALTGGHVAA